ncbi:deoxyribodipyrimidine photo-lyase [Marinobacteraceae bacterium S3BR75-40.1]
MTELVWLRNDLRLADNPALRAASESDESLEVCFVLTPEQWRQHDWAQAKVQLLHASLEALAQDLATLGIPFHVLSSTDFDASVGDLEKLCRERQVSRLHFNLEYAVNERQRDRQIKQRLSAKGIQVHAYHDQSVLPVGEVLTQQGTPYTVFTPFFKAWQQTLSEAPVQLYARPSSRGPALHPTPIPRITGFGEAPAARLDGSEKAAHQRLDDFLQERAGRYARDRDFPALDGTSQLSPYLALGVLSGKQCLVAARSAAEEAGAQARKGFDTWISEICWRDFYINILRQFPRVSRHQAFKPETDELTWAPTDERFQAWCEGRTGIPIVDAAMRQLNQTGWMHNRLRMVAAMFLTKNLWIDWREGERYFMQHLVDGYLPSNNGGWQWSASTGTDAAPYFRIFNPVTQSERFDPEGRFIRHYLPELRDLKGKTLFAPWTGRPAGLDYPEPLVNLKETRKQAIAAFKGLKA